jgi:glycosyltransferase involved in cell wall biosynthesis
MTQQKFSPPTIVGATHLFNMRPLEWVKPTAMLHIPNSIAANNISIVIPVKNNQAGIDRFLVTLVDNVMPQDYPKEVIIVDNNSDVPLQVTGEFPFSVKTFSCSKPGPAAARNVGVVAAHGEWVLFTDSDCVATPSMVSGYLMDDNECVAYAGFVDIVGEDYLSTFYRDVQAFHPHALNNNQGLEPWALVTANCLVLKAAFDAISGFDERFIYAGGEDTDLGFRLRLVGKLRYNWGAAILHEVNDGVEGFFSRFIRYGSGYKTLADLYGVAMWAKTTTPNPNFLVHLLHKAMDWGYDGYTAKQFSLDAVVAEWNQIYVESSSSVTSIRKSKMVTANQIISSYTF